MKRFLTLLLVLPFVTYAQDAVLIVKGTAGNFYLDHTAAPKESFYSIGRLYNISPKEIAPYNSTTLEKGLTIGQTIKIPLKEVNFTQTNNVAADEVSVPLYHKLEAKENLYQLSTRFNKVPVANLKSWNILKSESVSVGQNMIVGHLKVKKDLSALATRSTNVVVNTVQEEEPKKEVLKDAVVKAKPTVIAKEEVAETEKSTAVNEVEAAERALEAAKKKMEDAVKKEKQAKAAAEKTLVDKATVEKAAAEKVAEEKAKIYAAKEAAKQKAEIAKVAEKPVVEEAPKPKPAPKKPVVAPIEPEEVANNAKNFSGGIFKNEFNSEGEVDNGNAGVFKSTSGWEDGKYYCLYNKVQQHTIVKITNKTTGKFVYAKVLDAMPDLKQNANVIIRVSNAAADVLGANANNFDCKIEY